MFTPVSVHCPSPVAGLQPSRMVARYFANHSFSIKHQREEEAVSSGTAENRRFLCHLTQLDHARPTTILYLSNTHNTLRILSAEEILHALDPLQAQAKDLVDNMAH